MPQVVALSIIASMAKSHGGATFCVASMCEAAARTGVKQSLITIQAPKIEPEHLPAPDLVETVRIPGVRLSPARLSWAPALRAAVMRHCQQGGVQIIHSHGLWTYPNAIAASVARELKLPFIISTHGVLEPRAWRYHAWKKRPVWWLWERRNVRSASVLIATAQQEIAAFRAVGLRNPAALLPTGVDLPSVVSKQQTTAEGGRTALFLSRIHPTKGLLNLVSAWARVRPPNWRMVVCGPDECGHTQQVKRAVVNAGLSNVFDFHPPVYGADKEALYGSANLFILPTFTENFGIVIAEALAAAVPVITTKAAPWSELHTKHCGWWVDIGANPLASALKEATWLSDRERLEMGQRGRSLVSESYSWVQTGEQLEAVYRWALGQAPQPLFVSVGEGEHRSGHVLTEHDRATYSTK